MPRCRRRVPWDRSATRPAGRGVQRWLLALGCEYDAAVCLTDGDEADVRRALETFARLGAAPAVAVAQARLRHLGATSIPRGPRPRTRLDADGLTPRQQQVLDLVADRLTNAEIARRLFISERTVEHHISATLAKLGARTRSANVRADVPNLGGTHRFPASRPALPWSASA